MAFYRPDLVKKIDRFPTEHLKWLAKQRKGKRTVAIVGFAPSSRHLAPYDDPDVEIWGVNEAYAHNFMVDSNGNFRADRWFQLHKPWSYKRDNNRNDPDHWKWLQQEHPFPIYMQEKDPLVPSSVKYPLEEIVEKYLTGKVWRGEEVCRYFTSSFAYMCALALYLGFERIEVYGFEMATMTEYTYQKGSTEFWLGLAAGLGVEVQLVENCQLLKGAMYGYEVTQMINRQELEARLAGLNKIETEAVGVLNQAAGRRQALEKQINDMTTELQKLNPKSKRYKRLQKDIAKRIQERNVALQDELNKLGRANAIAGARQEIQMLIGYIDAQYNLPDVEIDQSAMPIAQIGIQQVNEELEEGGLDGG